MSGSEPKRVRGYLETPSDSFGGAVAAIKSSPRLPKAKKTLARIRGARIETSSLSATTLRLDLENGLCLTLSVQGPEVQWTLGNAGTSGPVTDSLPSVVDLDFGSSKICTWTRSELIAALTGRRIRFLAPELLAVSLEVEGLDHALRFSSMADLDLNRDFLYFAAENI